MKSIGEIAKEVCMETGHPVGGRLQAAIEAALKEVSRDTQQKLSKCHSAFTAVLDAETDDELREMRESLVIITDASDELSHQPAKVVAAGLIAMIDVLTETGYRNDGTCTGDADKCCGACGDEGVRGVPPAPPTGSKDTVYVPEKAQWGPLP